MLRLCTSTSASGRGSPLGYAGHLHEARKALLGQLRKLLLPGLELFRVNVHWQEIRIREVAVVVGLFLAAHGLGDVLVRVVEARLLDHLATVQDHVFLAGNLVGNGAAHVAEGVHVLELRAGAELFLAPGSDGDVGVTAEASLLHVAVAHP